MTLNDQLLFLFCGIGAANGLVLAVYFLRKSSQNISNAFLGAAFLALSIRVMKSVIYYFNPEISIEFLQMGLMACFCIGPCIYFYALSSVDKLESDRVPWKLHAGVLGACLIITSLVWPYSQNQSLWRNVVYKVINYSWLLYQISALIVLYPVLKKLVAAKGQRSDNEKWMLAVVGGVTAICLAYVFAGYTSYILATTSMSVLLFLGILTFVLRAREAPKYGGKKIENVESVIARIDDLMLEHQLYTNPDLTLASVAKRAGLPKASLSQALNETAGLSFINYVNQFRVEAAKKIMMNKPASPIEEILMQSGFNSQSTLYAAFKRATGTTPGQFKKRQKKQG